MAKIVGLTTDQGEAVADIARLVEDKFAAVQAYQASLAAMRQELADGLRRLAAFGRALSKPLGAFSPPITSVTVVRDAQSVVSAIYVNEDPPA